MSGHMQAVIMAGGEGSRLRPLTSNMPKPMLPVANRPIMEHIIELVRAHGITDITATVQFLSSVIRNYFSDGSDLGVSLSYSTEDVPLGTAGSVLNAKELLSGTFLVISGDALTDLDLTKVIEFHRAKGSAATLVLKRMQDPLEFGIVMTDDDGKIERFLEKPTWGQVFSDTINTGIYVLEPEVLDLIPPDQPYDFSSELFPLMLEKGLPLYGYVTDEYWTDVGNTDAYLQAQADALEKKVTVGLPGFEFQDGVYVGEDVEIDPTARLIGPVVIGDNSRIGAGAVVGPGAVIGSNAILAPDSRVARGVVLDRAYVGSARAGARGSAGTRSVARTRCDPRRRCRPRRRDDRRRRRVDQAVGEGLFGPHGRGRRDRDPERRSRTARDAESVRLARRIGSRQRRDHADGRGPARHGVRHDTQARAASS